MNLTNTSTILVENLTNKDGEALLRIQVGTAIALHECFSSTAISAYKMPQIEIYADDESTAWIKPDAALECLSAGLISHPGLRQAVFAALRSSGHKITTVKNVSLQIPADSVDIVNCHVATNLDSPGMEYVCNLEGEMIADLYCGDDHIPQVPIAFFSIAYAPTKDWLAESLRNNLRIGNADEQISNKILPRWGGGEWLYLDADLLPFAERFPWLIFDQHLAGRGRVKLDKSHFEQAIKDALYKRADSALEKYNLAAQQKASGSIHDVPWRQNFVDDAIHRHPELIEKDYGSKGTVH